MRHILAAAILVLAAADATAGDPARALQDAKSHLNAKRYKEAIQLLTPALTDAGQIADSDTREQALSAMEFYLAVAHSGAGDARKAREHLENFFQLTPHARGIDRSRYDARFVALFNELSPLAKKTSAVPFTAVYAPLESARAAADPPDGTWGTTLALEILGSRAEKDQWRDLTAQQPRSAFIDDFWRRRDPTPATPENEFRDTFQQRIAYADQAFGTPGSRGALTDRGRVFVLLGEPFAVQRRPLRKWDGVFVGETLEDSFESQYRSGQVEQWFYKREQLPLAVGKEMIGFRFITHSSLGVGVLQRDDDVYAKRALAVAANPQP